MPIIVSDYATLRIGLSTQCQSVCPHTCTPTFRELRRRCIFCSDRTPRTRFQPSRIFWLRLEESSVWLYRGPRKWRRNRPSGVVHASRTTCRCSTGAKQVTLQLERQRIGRISQQNTVSSLHVWRVVRVYVLVRSWLFVCVGQLVLVRSVSSEWILCEGETSGFRLHQRWRPTVLPMLATPVFELCVRFLVGCWFTVSRCVTVSFDWFVQCWVVDD